MKHFEDVQTGGYFQYMYRFILSISLVISCCAVSLGETPDVRFASGKSALNLPLRIYNNHVYLQVSVNNAKPLWFLLDTGVGSIIINLRNARALGLKLDPAGQTTGVGEGLADVFFAENVSFTLPGVTIAHEKFAVLSLENVEECSNKIDVDLQGKITWRAQAAKGDEQQPIDGVLGDEFFRLFVVEIDYAAKSINLYDPKSYHYQGKGERIPLEVTQNHIYMRAPITASGRSSINGLFMIDTGSAGALVLTSPFVEQHELLPPPSQTTPFSICGIGGDSQTQIGTLTEIRLGKLKIENPMTMFSQATNGVLSSPDFSGHVGNAILRRFKVVFDYSRRVMILDQK
jgi:hypothetical protein